MKERTGIYGFNGKNRFLSNFARLDVPISYLDREFWYSENAYQAAKCAKVGDRKKFVDIGPKEAKDLGKQVECRPDWEAVKVDIMKEICRLKFINNPRMLKLLLATGDLYLEETNFWSDRFWGVCRGAGKNQLGLILMELRDRLKEQLN